MKLDIILESKNENFWNMTQKVVMAYIQEQVSSNGRTCKGYIEMINKYQKYFNFEQYKLLLN